MPAMVAPRLDGGIHPTPARPSSGRGIRAPRRVAPAGAARRLKPRGSLGDDPAVRICAILRPPALRGAACALVAACAAAAPRAGSEATADLVLTGAAVYTVDAARSWAQAVAVRGGRIVYVGGDAGARAFVGPTTRVVPLAGRMLLPGFQDAHVHPLA